MEHTSSVLDSQTAAQIICISHAWLVMLTGSWLTLDAYLLLRTRVGKVDWCYRTRELHFHTQRTNGAILKKKLLKKKPVSLSGRKITVTGESCITPSPQKMFWWSPESLAELIGEVLPHGWSQSVKTGNGGCFFKCSNPNTKLQDTQRNKERCLKETKSVSKNLPQRNKCINYLAKNSK